MKFLYSTLIFILFSLSINAQQVEWVSKQGGTAVDQTNDIATDTAGNVFIVGTFDGTATLGSLNITTYGSSDIFLAKYNSTGTCLWVKKAGGTFGDEGRGIAVDSSGNIYITGIYGQSGAQFDGISVGTTGGLRNGFVAKYSPAGDVIWVKRIGGTSSGPEPRKIAVNSNKVYVAGEFYGTITFDGQFSVSSTQPGGFNDVFLAQFDTAGTAQWANRGGDRKDEKLNGLAIDPSGNPIIYGSYDSLTTFNTTTKYAEYLGSTFGHNDMYLVKYTPSGGMFWFASFGGGELDEAGGVCVDGSGNIYTTGYFKTNFVSGSVTANNSGTTNTLFLHKLNSNGNPLWVKFSAYPNSIGFQRGLALACSKNEILLAGYFGNIYKAGNDVLTGSGENNPLIIKYDTSGTTQWGMFGNGAAFKISKGLGVAISGNRYYYAGYITGGVTFNTNTITAPGTYADGFICAVTGGGSTPTVDMPTSLTVSGATTTSVQLNWTGTSSEFRVLSKPNATSTSPTDGTVIYEGTNLSYNYTSLTPNTPYYITVYGKASGSNTFSATARKIAATTVSNNLGTDIIVGFIAGQTGSTTFGTSRVKINISGASVSDGNIRVEKVTNLVAGTLPVNIDSIFSAIYWRVTSTGLTGGSLRYCITIDATDAWGLVSFLNYHILKRPTTGAPWEDLFLNSSFTVTQNSPELTVCGLSSFSEFAIAMDNPGVGINASNASNSYRIYPNPAQNYFTLEFTKAPTEVIEIYNMQGQLVRSIDPENKNVVRVERNGLVKGLYLVKVGGVVGKVRVE